MLKVSTIKYKHGMIVLLEHTGEMLCIITYGN